MAQGQRKATALLTSDAMRFLQIEHMLRSGGADFQQLRGRLGVSPATLKRDLKAMREELGAPIQYDRLADQYRLTSPWPGIKRNLLELFQ